MLATTSMHKHCFSCKYDFITVHVVSRLIGCNRVKVGLTEIAWYFISQGQSRQSMQGWPRHSELSINELISWYGNHPCKTFKLDKFALEATQNRTVHKIRLFSSRYAWILIRLLVQFLYYRCAMAVNRCYRWRILACGNPIDLTRVSSSPTILSKPTATLDSMSGKGKISVRNLASTRCNFQLHHIKVLGIETSCDDTGAAIVTDQKQILSESLYNQGAIHNEYVSHFKCSLLTMCHLRQFMIWYWAFSLLKNMLFVWVFALTSNCVR